MTNSRDPRLRRQQQPGGVFAPVDVAAAAMRLEVAAGAMRAEQLQRGPDPAEVADVATAVQLGTTAGPLTAQAFADALREDVPDGFALDVAAADALADSPPPAPVAPMPPVDGAPAPAPAFSAERSLTWRSRHDARSLSYGIRPTLPGSAPLTDHLWPVGPVLDQGTEGACVGFAIVDAVNASRPGDVDLGPADALAIFHRADQIDGDGRTGVGTSVLAGMKAAVEAGLFGGYRWAFGTRDVAQTVLQVGPVVVGVPWLSGMYETGPGGLVTLTGADQGLGHCLAVVGLRLKGPQGQPGPFFVWQNSWSPSYGDGGLGYIHHRDLAALLHGTGEAAVPMAGAQHVPV